MDRMCLELQNTLYEIRHFENKIAECEELETEYQDLELISETRIATADPDAMQVDDPHLVMLKRLNMELVERKRLMDEEASLQQEFKRVEEQSLKEQLELDALDKELLDALKATAPLQTRLGIPNASNRDMAERLDLLPEPLFVLYKHAVGYAKTTADDTVAVDVRGDMTLARADESGGGGGGRRQSSAGPASTSVGAGVLKRSVSTEDLDADNMEQEGAGGSKAHADRSATYYRKHPLSVVLTISAPAGKKAKLARMTFAYLTHLEIVVVATEQCAPLPNVPPTLLASSLFPGDMGTTSPNPANAFLGSELFPFRFDPTVAGGHAFAWAQTLCGLAYPTRPTTTTATATTLRHTMTNLPLLVRNRVSALEGLSVSLAKTGVPTAASGVGPGKGRDVTWRFVHEDPAEGSVYDVEEKGGTEETTEQWSVTIPPAALSAGKAKVSTVVKDKASSAEDSSSVIVV
ncbi:THO complex subunit 5 [Thoreauomyces humboldtii]|nr:THO complex subunit 5 [Thoreauomyces humboldtii]